MEREGVLVARVEPRIKGYGPAVVGLYGGVTIQGGYHGVDYRESVGRGETSIVGQADVGPIGVDGKFGIGVADEMAATRRLDVEHRGVEDEVVREYGGVDETLIGSLTCFALGYTFTMFFAQLFFVSLVSGRFGGDGGGANGPQGGYGSQNNDGGYADDNE